MSQPSAPKPPMFSAPPRSALFSKLESFLPVMATENKKLEEAIAAGEGDRHNIEIPEPDAAGASDDKHASDDSDADVDMDATSTNDKKERAPVIEMNFALGMMGEDALDSNSDSDSEDDDNDIDLAASIAGITRGDAKDADDSTLRLPSQQPQQQTKKKPMIVELN
ncbi:hypothetical protein PINS_up007108 [Pythium insidiosum]|nr:hypothetical protein PINS_up007108 [Pythium insidiosum]